jgi:hypothetical protein
MRYINVPIVVNGKNDIQKEIIYNKEEVDFLSYLFGCKESHKTTYKNKVRKRVSYIEIPCAFDIETTNVYDRGPDGKISKAFRPFSVMYQWQFCIDDKVIFGRRWEEFIELLQYISDCMNLSDTRRLVVWVHNLPFEFLHMYRFLRINDGFYKEAFKPLNIVTSYGIEFRCSYALSNMSLIKFCQNSRGCIHYKLEDKYDYSKIRTADTPLTEEEQAYCYNDVRGLCECIADRLRSDTLATIPLTSTGYVRRDARNKMRKNKKNRQLFVDSALDEKLYLLMRDAFRGGDTHANYLFANETIRGPVYSYDITSSYPASMMIDDYPIGAFFPIDRETFNDILTRRRNKYCFVCRLALKNPRYVGTCGVPYIPVSKCTKRSKNRVEDNGRILSAELIEIACTDIDYDIILSEYEYDDIYVYDTYAAMKGKLPAEFRECVMEYYRLKTELKDVDGKEYEYARAKERLNALYGMMVMRIDQSVISFDGHDFHEEEKPIGERLEKYYKSRNSFLAYQWGVWVTANSRKRLRDMLRIIGRDVVYCDTDSIKYVGNHRVDFARKNNELRRQAIAAGAYADNKDGKRFYLGLWDNETKPGHEYQEFRTLGAKKYVVQQNGKYKSTIAGVNKKVGAAFFNRHGIEAFRIGQVIENSGHLVAYYNRDEIHTVTVDGCTMTTAANVALVDDTYTIGVTGEYMDLLQKALEMKANIEYY